VRFSRVPDRRCWPRRTARHVHDQLREQVAQFEAAFEAGRRTRPGGWVVLLGPAKRVERARQRSLEILQDRVDVFGNEPRPDEPTVDLKVLNAKIGQLTLENDYLKGALIKAGLLSAKR